MKTMMTVRPANQRGTANFGWLESKHSFSFGNYYDPNQMGFASLRVINEDKVQPGKGFGTHSHRDMEIISYVLEGSLEHKDSIGNGSIIRPGDVQRMSAGTGISHSEFNASSTAPVHFLQIWILPDRNGLEPSYEQKHFSPEEKQGKLKLVGSRDGGENSVIIHQDVNLYLASLNQTEKVEHVMKDNRLIWVQVAKGAINLNGESLSTRDGIAIADENELQISATLDKTEVLLFDMAQVK